MLEIGDTVPEDKVLTSEGNKISLQDFSGKPVILYFYPRDETPGCTKEACDFRDAKQTFEDLDVEIVGVSPDSMESHESFKKKFNLPFTLVTDEDARLAKAFGVWKLKEKAGKTYHGNERATFIINEESKISHVFRDVKVEGHVSETLNAVKNL